MVFQIGKKILRYFFKLDISGISLISEICKFFNLKNFEISIIDKFTKFTKNNQISELLKFRKLENIENLIISKTIELPKSYNSVKYFECSNNSNKRKNKK